jgi:hypothetical protein
MCEINPFIIGDAIGLHKLFFNMPIGHGPKRFFFLKSFLQIIDSLSVFHAVVLLSACIYPPVMTWHWILCGWSLVELVFYAWFHKELFERQASNEFTMSDEQRRVFVEQSMHRTFFNIKLNG